MFKSVHSLCIKTDWEMTKIICFKNQMIPPPPLHNFGQYVSNQRFTILSFFKKLKKKPSFRRSTASSGIRKQRFSVLNTIFIHFEEPFVQRHSGHQTGVFYSSFISTPCLHTFTHYTCIHKYSFTRNIFSSPMMPLIGERLGSIFYVLKSSSLRPHKS